MSNTFRSSTSYAKSVPEHAKIKQTYGWILKVFAYECYKKKKNKFSVAVLFKIWHLSCATLRCDGIRNYNWLNKSLPIVSHFLQAVIHGQEKSRWLRSFLSDNRRRVVNIYLEDDHQLDQVYCYLNELYTAAVANAPCVADVKSMDRVPFVLDVLLPEVS